MRIATDANSRTTQAARSSLPKALDIAFGGGTVMGLGVAGLAVLGLSLFFMFFMNQFMKKKMGKKNSAKSGTNLSDFQIIKPFTFTFVNMLFYSEYDLVGNDSIHGCNRGCDMGIEV